MTTRHVREIGSSIATKCRNTLMQIKLTGFGHTFVDGDHPLWAIIGCALAIVLLNLFFCRLYGYYHPEQPETEEPDKTD